MLSGKPKPRNPENWRNSDDARRTNRLRRNVDTPKGDEEKPRRRTRRRSRNRWQDNESATHDSRTGRRAVTKPRSDSDAEQPKRRRWRRRPAEAPDPEAKGSGPKPAKPGSGTDKPAGDGSSRRRRRRRNRRQAEPAVAEPVYDDMGFPLVNLADVRNAKAKEAKNATGTDVPVKPNVNPPTANPKTITVEGTGSTGSGDSAATPPKPAAQPKPPKAPAAASVTSTNGGNPMSPTATAPPEVVANPFLFEIDPNSSNSIASQMRTGAAEARQQGTEFATAAGDMRRKAAAAEGKGLHNAAAGFRRAASKNTVLADNRFGIADRLEAEADAQTKASA